MSDTNELKLLVESLAITIHDHIRDLQADASMQSYRRWVWELLQNAIDLSLDEQECVIRYTTSNDSVEFQHNGKLFNHDSLNHLFFKKSSKRDKTNEERVIGNFGTGFLTTHLLSKIISLSGIYQKKDQTYTQFENFLLNREGNFHEITANILEYIETRNTLEESSQSSPYNSAYPSNTRFLYKIGHPLQITAAERGMRDLESCLPYSLIFISHLKQIKNLKIEMINHLDQAIEGKTTQIPDSLNKINDQVAVRTDFEFNFKTQIFNSLTLHTINVKKQNESKCITILEIHNDSIQICLNVQVKLDHKHPSFKIKERQNQEANWFAVFPLIGTEQINYPFIVNSFDFIPTKERNGLILFGPDTERVDVNKALILEVLKMSKKFVLQVVSDIQQKKSKWSNLHLLANIQLPENKKEYIDIEWYKENIVKDYRKFLFEQPLVLTDDGYRPLKDIKLPFNKDEAKTKIFARLCRRVFKDDIPVEKVLIPWLSMFVKEENLWPQNQIKYSVESLTKHISDGGFKTFLWNFKNSETKAYDLLNDLINIIEEENPELLSLHPILPNQLGEFKAPAHLNKDEEIPELYKNMILEITQKNWREFLVDNKILNLKSLKNSKHIIDIEKELLQIFEDQSQEQQILFGKAIIYLNILNTKQPSANSDEQKQLLQLIKSIYPSIIKIEEWQGECYFKNFSLQRIIMSFVVDHIMKTVQQYQNLTLLFKVFSNFQDITELEDWIFQFICFMNSHKYVQYKSGQKIFPNIYGTFIECPNVIIDKQINNYLLKILIDITKYNNDYLQKQFNSKCTLKDIRILDINLVKDKFNFPMTNSLDNYGILEEILKAVDNYHNCVRSLLNGPNSNSEEELKKTLQMQNGMNPATDLIRCINLDQLDGIQKTIQKNQDTRSLNKKLLDLWIYNKDTSIEQFIGQEILSIKFINDHKIKGLEKLYELLLFQTIIQLDQKGSILEEDDRFLKIINQVLDIWFLYKFDTTFFTNVFSKYKIIPNQENQLKAIDKVQLDYNDITKTFGSPVKLKQLYDSMNRLQFESDQKYKRLQKSHNFYNETSFKETPFISVFSELVVSQIQQYQIGNHNTSLMLKYIDKMVQKDRNIIEKKDMMNLYSVLHSLSQENQDYMGHLRNFNKVKLSIFSEFFQDEMNNGLMFDLMESGNLQKFWTLQKCLLHSGTQTNTIIYNNFKDEICQDLLDKKIKFTIIKQKEIILIDQLKTHICFLFTHTKSHILNKDHLILIKQHVEKKLDIVIIFIDKPEINPIKNSRCFKDYNSSMIQKLEIKQEIVVQSNEKDLNYDDGVEWTSYLEQLKKQIGE